MLDATGEAARPFSERRARTGDVLLQGVAGLAALGAVVLLGLIAYKIVDGARLSLSTFGLGFLTHVGWDPVHSHFGAGGFLFGTVVTSIGALVLATPLALGIALFLTELAPRWIRGPVTALVETLAAIPSVVIGLWGILVLGPLLHDHVMPALHSTLGFIPLFGPSTTGSTIFTAASDARWAKRSRWRRSSAPSTTASAGTCSARATHSPRKSRSSTRAQRRTSTSRRSSIWD
jgi:phosphate transport system permease protein